MKHNIDVVFCCNEMPEPYERVLTSGDVSYWDGVAWHSATHIESVSAAKRSRDSVVWWVALPTDKEVLTKHRWHEGRCCMWCGISKKVSDFQKTIYCYSEALQ